MEDNKLIHIWETQEITLIAQKNYTNPYLEVDVWIDLIGPGFNKRIYGFWDGGNTFKIRFVAESPGEWSWVSSANVVDTGLQGVEGLCVAEGWTEKELELNPLRRGFIRSTSNRHAFEHADGTPFYLLADTWWSTATWRYPWGSEEPDKVPIVHENMSFQDMVQYRKNQEFNGIAMIAAFPNWDDDGYPATLILDDEKKTTVRAAWPADGNQSIENYAELPAKTMENEGGKAFLCPGKVPGLEQVIPDLEKINPVYFQYLDRKIDYLNANGMVAFIEAIRRDISQLWKNYYPWPDSYARYVHYIFSRYHAHHTLLSPVHYDFAHYSIPSREFNRPANDVVSKYGSPPHGNPVGTNAGPSTLLNFGTPNEAAWLTFHQIGNWREHTHYWHLTEIYHSDPTLPAMNGEPYYPGFPDNIPHADSREAERNCRSGMYGSFLSGGFAGYIYGAEGMWAANREESSANTMWEALQYDSGKQVSHLKEFIFSIGSRYQDLIPNAELIVPNKAGDPYGYTGWAYCAHTPDKKLVMCYFEENCPQPTIRSILPDCDYDCYWFNPRSGNWVTDPNLESSLKLHTDQIGCGNFPKLPDAKDWALLMIMSD